MSQLPDAPDLASPAEWQRLIEAVDPASLLFVIERRLGHTLRAQYAAEDVLQEALLQAWRSRGEFEWRGLPSFRQWLLTIIERRIRDLADLVAARKRGGGFAQISLERSRAHGATTAGGDDGFPAATTTPSRLAMYREQADAMQRALESLPEELREVVRLRLFEQRPLLQIAAELSIGEAAVRHRFRKGSELYVLRLKSELGSRVSHWSQEK
ncbi:MAG: sigma-70 family RNA polymerase sigma factor [Planctomycetes bacterium]|nr:sigma-70 family RNA polymerase sigma factor [Planctomycetota bacterium]